MGKELCLSHADQLANICRSGRGSHHHSHDYRKLPGYCCGYSKPGEEFANRVIFIGFRELILSACSARKKGSTTFMRAFNYFSLQKFIPNFYFIAVKVFKKYIR